MTPFPGVTHASHPLHRVRFSSARRLPVGHRARAGGCAERGQSRRVHAAGGRGSEPELPERLERGGRALPLSYARTRELRTSTSASTAVITAVDVRTTRG